jgi:hypothetical protein
MIQNTLLAAIQLGGVTLSLWERRFFPDLGAAIHEKGATAQIAYRTGVYLCQPEN